MLVPDVTEPCRVLVVHICLHRAHVFPGSANPFFLHTSDLGGRDVGSGKHDLGFSDTLQDILRSRLFGAIVDCEQDIEQVPVTIKVKRKGKLAQRREIVCLRCAVRQSSSWLRSTRIGA